jgi:hypothetical protein
VKERTPAAVVIGARMGRGIAARGCAENISIVVAGITKNNRLFEHLK